MTRSKLVTTLSILYLLGGVWDLFIFLYQSSSSSRPVYLDITRLVGGILALYIGFQLLQMHEIGRKFAIGLSCFNIAISLYFMIWFLSHREGVVRTGFYFLKKEIYHIDNPYASEAYLFAVILVALLVIVFLSQGKTKKLFGPKTSNDSGVTSMSV
jgi:hypothetical protein